MEIEIGKMISGHDTQGKMPLVNRRSLDGEKPELRFSINI